MEILRVAAFALCAAVLASALNRYTPWASLLISMAAGTLIVLYLMPQISRMADELSTVFTLADGGSGYTGLLLRVTAITFVAQMCAQICTDAGQKALGDKIETAARVFIAVYSLPLISDMLKMITSFLGG